VGDLPGGALGTAIRKKAYKRGKKDRLGTNPINAKEGHLSARREGTQGQRGLTPPTKNGDSMRSHHRDGKKQAQEKGRATTGDRPLRGEQKDSRKRFTSKGGFIRKEQQKRDYSSVKRQK